MRVFIALGLAVAWLPTSLPAQQSCTYDQCALRLEQNRIVAGAEGRRIGSLGFLTSTDLTTTFAISDSAAFHYDVFRDNYVSGTVWSMLSGGALGVALLGGFDMSNTMQLGLIATSIVAGAIGGHKTRRAQSGLSRAMWWHNRALPK
jgi:hypothetical protein